MFGGYYGTDLRQDYSNNDKLTLYLGAFYRLKDAIVPIVKLDYYKVTLFKLGINYVRQIKNQFIGSNRKRHQ